MIKLKLPKLNINFASFAYKSLFYLSLVLFLLSLTLQITITNKYAIKGSEMVALSAQKAELEREISALNLKVSELSSLANVEKRALSLGFIEYSSPIALVGTSQFVALR